VLTPGDSRSLIHQESFRRDLFPKMLSAAQALATAAAQTPATSARQLASITLGAELARLEDLATRNTRVSEAELTALRSVRDETLTFIAAPRLRLDALRLVWRS
jgi:hypothetical protein